MPKTYYDYQNELTALLAERRALRTRIQAIARRVNSVRVSMHRTANKIPTDPFGGLVAAAPAPVPAQSPAQPTTIVRQIDDLSPKEFNRLLADIQSDRS